MKSFSIYATHPSEMIRGNLSARMETIQILINSLQHIIIFLQNKPRMIQYANSKEKIQKILDESGGIAVLDFCTKTCSDCDKLDPYVKELNAQKNIPVIKIDTEQCKDLCQCCHVSKVPAFGIVKEKWDNCSQCKECHEKDEVLEIFNRAAEWKSNLHKSK